MVVIGSKNIKELVGTVTSTKNDKSITVEVERVRKHPLYGKRFTMAKKFYAHDEKNEANEGDTVRIREAIPTSKTKRRKLIEVVTN